MDLNKILEGVGQFAGAMNPDYQAGVEMAKNEMQRKKYRRLMSSPMMQKALGETFGPEVAPMMIEAAGAMPMKEFGQFAGMFPKRGAEKTPTTAEAALMAGDIDIDTFRRIKDAGRENNPTPFETWLNAYRRDTKQRTGRYPTPSEEKAEIEKWRSSGGTAINMGDLPSLLNPQGSAPNVYSDNLDQEIKNAHDAIAQGANAANVKAKFKQRTGKDLPTRE